MQTPSSNITKGPGYSPSCMTRFCQRQNSWIQMLFLSSFLSLPCGFVCSSHVQQQSSQSKWEICILLCHAWGNTEADIYTELCTPVVGGKFPYAKRLDLAYLPLSKLVPRGKNLPFVLIRYFFWLADTNWNEAGLRGPPGLQQLPRSTKDNKVCSAAASHHDPLFAHAENFPKLGCNFSDLVSAWR